MNKNTCAKYKKAFRIKHLIGYLLVGLEISFITGGYAFSQGAPIMTIIDVALISILVAILAPIGLMLALCSIG